MIDTEQILEFDKIKKQLKELAYTKNAKDKIDDLAPYIYQKDLLTNMRETSEARMLVKNAGNPPATALSEIDEYLLIAKKGGCLSAEQLENIGVSLTAVRRLKDYLIGCKRYECSLAYYEENLDCVTKLREEIEMMIRGGRVDDYATKLLKNIRADISMTKNRMQEKADSVMRANKEYMSDSFCTMRNGHVCIPVKKDYKFKIQGTVVDKSATGNTVFVEPSSASKYYDELQSLLLDEENEVRRILYTLTDLFANESDVIEENNRTIEKLDFIFAKGKLSLILDAVEPKINTDKRIVIKDGRHPLMDKEINIPLQFQIGDGINGIVITGPNTGGKTVAIKTVALNCMMAQCGLHVTCLEADICMNNAYLCDIGDNQNISENLSTFSAHIMNVLEILKRADKDSLVIMDELGSGTDPTEGMGIAISILAELKKSGALYLVTTHYPEVKNYAENEEGVINARMTFDKETLKPLYQLVIGEAGQSCAFYIARRLGMPMDMLKRASIEAYGHVDEKLIKNSDNTTLTKENTAKIHKKKNTSKQQSKALEFSIGDSVMIYPDRKIGIVCEQANEKGVIRIQLQNKKIWINYKRVKLVAPASMMYPEGYDFSIVFDSVENRKLRHDMERKYVEDAVIKYDK